MMGILCANIRELSFDSQIFLCGFLSEFVRFFVRRLYFVYSERIMESKILGFIS